MLGVDDERDGDEPDHLEREAELHDACRPEVAGEVAAELRPDDR